MGEACSTHEGGNIYAIFWLENLKERDHFEDLKVDGRDLRQTGWEGVDWIHLAQDRDLWRTFVNTVMNLPSSIKCG
jgi:hypothetical protein